MSKRTPYLFLSLLILTLLFAFQTGCSDSGDNADEDGDHSTDGDEPADGDAPENTTESCEGSCSLSAPAFCVGDSVCNCIAPFWMASDCDDVCAQSGKVSDGCGLVSSMPMQKGCLCKDSDGDVDGDVDGDADGDMDEEQIVGCAEFGFTPQAQIAELSGPGPKLYWKYTGYSKTSFPLNMLVLENFANNGGPTEPGTYTIGENETSYQTCGLCLRLRKSCNYNNAGELVCGSTYMPKPGGTITIEALGDWSGEDFTVKLENVEMQQVVIGDDGVTTAIEEITALHCFEQHSIDAELYVDGYTELDPPDDLTCDYPPAPYYFLGPEGTNTHPEACTVPPMGWPSAYLNDQEVGFNLARFKCEHPEINTLFVLISAGWCPACTQFYRDTFCVAGGIHDHLKELNAEVLWVVTQDANGDPTTSDYANQRVNFYGCEGGYRISDNDNTAGRPVIADSWMFDAFPWSAAIRMSDMKLIKEQGRSFYLLYEIIAQQNNAAAADGDEDGDAEADDDTATDGDAEADDDTATDGDAEADDDTATDGDAEADDDTATDGDAEADGDTATDGDTAV